MQATLSNADLAASASEALVTAGLSANASWQVVDLLPPAGHHELLKALAVPGALAWLSGLWFDSFAERFRTSSADAVRIQRILREANR